jgi:hypothetical protein
VLRDRLQHSIFLFHSLFIMYTTFSIGTSCIVKNNEYAVPPPRAFHPDIPVHLLCSSTSLVVEHERAGETRVRQRACHFRQAMRAGVPRCGTLLHIYSTATYIFPINHTYLQCRPKQPLIPSDGLGSSLIFTANYISQTYRECQEITSSLPSRSLASSAN